MKVVHWKDIVGKDFMKKFIDMVKAEQYLTHKNLSWNTMADKFGLDDLQKYTEKRSIMRRHGWFEAYLEDGEIMFMSIYPVGERNYISLAQYLNAREAERIAQDEEEYYSTKGTVYKVGKEMSKPKPRKDIDGDDDTFVVEGSSVPNCGR